MQNMEELSRERLEAILASWLEDYTLEECHDMGGQFEAAERELERRDNPEHEPLKWYEIEYENVD